MYLLNELQGKIWIPWSFLWEWCGGGSSPLFSTPFSFHFWFCLTCEKPWAHEGRQPSLHIQAPSTLSANNCLLATSQVSGVARWVIHSCNDGFQEEAGIDPGGELGLTEQIGVLDTLRVSGRIGMGSAEAHHLSFMDSFKAWRSGVGQLLSRSKDSTGLGESDYFIVDVTMVKKTMLDTITCVF